MLEFTVPEGTDSIKISDFLRQRGISQTLRRKIKQKGKVLLNGREVNLAAIATAGDRLEISLPAEPKLVPTSLPLQVIYEDQEFLVVNKPPGMLVHPTTKLEYNTLANAVLYYYQQHGLDCDFHPVHRLDRNTSGLVLIAKHPYIQHYLCQNYIEKVQRFYIALITGKMPTIEGIINAPIGRSPDSIIRRIVRPDGQKAITKYRTIDIYHEASLVEVEPITGRTHQIRAHFAAIGHPLLGDDLYGGSRELIGRQALHAAKLTFTNPINQATISVTADLSEDMQELIKRLRTRK